jgi:hypothetical protein
MQDHSTDELNIKMPHTKRTAARFSADSESLHQQLLKCFAIG